VKNYIYDFVLVDCEPRVIEVNQASKASGNFRQGIAYYTVLHKLAIVPERIGLCLTQ
jgi:hypothetical protein